MIGWLLAGLMAAAAGYQIVAIIACVRHYFRRDPEPIGDAPAVSVLKPVRGADPNLRKAFLSHVAQDHPRFELLFGAASPGDPAMEEARRLASDYPKAQIHVIESTSNAPNGKVAVLGDLQRVAGHSLLVVNDSDIEVAPDYLRRVTAPLNDARIGLVTCLYAAEARTFEGRFEALGISTDFAPSVLVAPLFGINEFGLGSTLAFHVETLRKIGGFDSIASYLADDYQLGRRVSEAGYKVHMSKVVVRTHLGASGWRDVWSHQVRWARTVRVSRSAGYAGSIVTNASLWALFGAMAGMWQAALMLITMRYAMGAFAGIALLDCRITRRYWWLMPARDLFGAAVWAAGLAGSEVRWRDQVLRIDGDGRIVSSRTL